jgi:hypothetical protein
MGQSAAFDSRQQMGRSRESAFERPGRRDFQDFGGQTTPSCLASRRSILWIQLHAGAQVRTLFKHIARYPRRRVRMGRHLHPVDKHTTSCHISLYLASLLTKAANENTLDPALGGEVCSAIGFQRSQSVHATKSDEI